MSNTKHGWDDLNRALPRGSLPIIVTDHFMIVQCLSEAHSCKENMLKILILCEVLPQRPFGVILYCDQ